MGFPVLLGQAPHMILGYTTVSSLIVFGGKKKTYIVTLLRLTNAFFGLTEKSRDDKLFHPKYPTAWFRKCAPWIPSDHRPVPRESVDTFL